MYFQPPASLRMTYPAIVYSRSTIENTYADNSPYVQGVEYKLVVIDKNPDSGIVKKFLYYLCVSITAIMCQIIYTTTHLQSIIKIIRRTDNETCLG